MLGRISLRRTLLSISLALAALPCFPQGTAPKDFAGTWVMRLGERTIFVLTLHPENGRLVGTFDRPSTFSSEGNTVFSDMRGGVRHDTVAEGQDAEGTLHLTVQNATSPSEKTKYVMAVDGDHATLSEEDTMPSTPYVFQRTQSPASVSTDWEPNRAYTASDFDTDNKAMKVIYDEDQRVRTVQPIDWKAVNKSDEERRETTRKLLAAGALHTGTDYEEAAFIFQHGLTPDDYLLAHTLATVAISKGDSDAIWIAAATLDRYLQRIGQKQIYGSQYSSTADHHWTQEPYNAELISDALREQLGEEPAAVDKERLKFLNSQAPPTVTK